MSAEDGADRQKISSWLASLGCSQGIVPQSLCDSKLDAMWGFLGAAKRDAAQEPTQSPTQTEAPAIPAQYAAKQLDSAAVRFSATRLCLFTHIPQKAE